MNKVYLLAFFFSAVLVNGCKKDDSSSPQQNSCVSINSFTAVQQDDALKLTINSSGIVLYYECTAQLPGNTPPTNGSGSSGYFAVPPDNSIYLRDILYNPGTYLIYVRAVCASGAGNWSSPLSVVINAYCTRPFSLNYTGINGFQWSADGVPSQYQVQYGVKGFAIGSGTIATVTTKNYDDDVLNAGITYDYYVRLNCGTGWSSWVGPYSYLSTSIKNQCTKPSGANYTVEYSGATPVGANFTWAYNGEKRFEFTWVPFGSSVTSGTIYTHNANSATTPTIICARNTNYDFYVRAVCVSGSKTAWSDPKLFNIH